MTGPLSAAAERPAVSRVPMGHPFGRRIAVVGHGGKSTLARAVAARLGLPVVELDALFWKPGWVETGTDEFKSRVEAAIAAAPGGWIVDGNYWSRLGSLVIGQVDQVIWVKMPWRVMFWRLFLRAIRRARDSRPICGENYETWRHTFLSRKSLLWWHITTRRTYRERGMRLLTMIPPGVPLIELASPHDLDRFYVLHGLRRD